MIEYIILLILLIIVICVLLTHSSVEESDKRAPLVGFPRLEGGLGNFPRLEGGLGNFPRLEGGLGNFPRLEGGLGNFPRLEGGLGNFPHTGGNRPPFFRPNPIRPPLVYPIGPPPLIPIGPPVVTLPQPIYVNPQPVVQTVEYVNSPINLIPSNINLTVVPKNSGHPYQAGSMYGYAVNTPSGPVQGALLNLKRNTPYTFSVSIDPRVASSGPHPLFFSTNPIGGGTSIPISPIPGVLTNTQIPNPSVATFTATFDSTAPSSFYYECGLHAYMGGSVNLT